MKAKRIDANQKEIVEAFRSLGCSVFITSAVGKGFPDIVVGFRGKNYLFEIKDGDKFKSSQKLTEPERLFFRDWSGQCAVINCVDQVIYFINNMT